MASDLSIESRIKEVIVRSLTLSISPDEIDSDAQLFGGGLGLNSIATMEIIVGIEEEFDIEVPDEDLRVELFDSVKAMASYVASVVERPESHANARNGSRQEFV